MLLINDRRTARRSTQVLGTVAVVASLLSMLLLGSAPEVGPQINSLPQVETCGVIYDAGGGEYKTKVLPSVQVMNIGDTDFVLPKDAPKTTAMVTCGRSIKLTPEPNDYKVVLAGYPLSIVAPDRNRVAVLEVIDGRLQFRMLEGEMTDTEIELVQKYLNENQPYFYRTN